MVIDDHQRVHLSNQFGLPFSSGGKVLIKYLRNSSSVSSMSEIGTLAIPQWIKMLSLEPKTTLMG